MGDFFSRRNFLAAGAAVLAARRVRAQNLEKLVFQTGWLAQAEHGGFYQALATGLYRDAGIDCTIRMGGPQIDTNAVLMAGRADVILSDGLTSFNYVREGLPFIEIGAIFQKDPRVLLAHPGMGVAKLEDLKGKTILVANSSRNSYWPWLRAKFGFADEQIRPYTFSMAPFLADKTLSQQGLLTSEPFDLRRAGVDPVVLLLADYGFGNYSETLNTSAKLVAEKPELLQRFVDATINGWISYLHGDPAPANALIKQANPDMDDDKIAYSRTAMIDNGIVQSGDATQLGIGAMTDARWHRFYDDMVAAGVAKPGMDFSRGYTTQFVNKRVGLT
jgi:NitT/TauT family transport system substrate-binding protein